VKWLIEHSTSHKLLWCIDSFVLRNPPKQVQASRLCLGDRKKMVKLKLSASAESTPEGQISVEASAPWTSCWSNVE